MNATDINTFVTILGILVGLGFMSGLIIERRKRQQLLIGALHDTIQSIRKGRQVKLAVLEDFPSHKHLFEELRPYLICRSQISKTMHQYEQWHEVIRKAGERSVLNILGTDWESEIDRTIAHLEHLKQLI